VDPITFFKESLATSSRVIDDVKQNDLNNPTPDTEWTVADLIAHMLYELAWSADIIAGKSLSEVGKKYDTDLIGDDLQASWHNFREAALRALDKPSDVAHLSYGDVPMNDYLRQAGSDQSIHAWDLAEGLNRELVYDDELAAELLAHVEARKDDLAASGLFAPPIEVSEDASTQTKLLALYGRSDAWRQSGKE